MTRYAILVTVNGASIVNPAWRAGLTALAEGRDPETVEGETTFNRFVLRGTEDEVRALVALNANVPPAVRSVLVQDTALWQFIEFSDTKDTATLEARLRQWARELGFTHAWTLSASDALPGLTDDLVPLFLPL